MKIKIERAQRKTICLKMIDSENAVLKVPKSLSEKKVEEFLRDKRVWLEKTSANLAKIEMFSQEFDLKNFVYFDCKKVMPTNQLAMDFEAMTSAKQKAIIKKFYLSLFYKLEDEAKKLSMQTGLKYDKLASADSTRIWGSYNSKRVMKLNYKLVILPHRLVEYVIIHELCHSKFMNHKPKFWQNVEKILPDYKARRKELKSYSFLLQKSIF